MPVNVHLTRMLVRHLDLEPEFNVDAKNLGDLLDAVDKDVEGFRDSVCDETGEIRTYVNVFLNGNNVSQDSRGLSVPLRDGDEIYILANIAGGTLWPCNSSWGRSKAVLSSTATHPAGAGSFAAHSSMDTRPTT